MTRIAIVDDEIHYSRIYERTLSADGFSVERFSSVAKAKSAFETKEYDFLIIDLMMPANPELDPEENDLLTGAYLSKSVESKNSKSKIVLFSVVHSGRVKERAKEILGPNSKVTFLDKKRYSPEDLSKFIQDQISGQATVGIVRRIWHALVLQPNFFGVGMDVRKLFSKRE